MPSLRPISRRELLRRLRALGFDGPYQEGKHPFMIRGELRLTIPNPHGEDIRVDLLNKILRVGVISRKEWDEAKN